MATKSNLSLNCFDEKLYQKLSNFHAQKFGHDFSIFIDGEEITANKYILLTRSGFFERNIPLLATSVDLKGFKAEDIKKVVEILETNYAEIDKNEKDEFLKLLDCLEIVGVKEVIHVYDFNDEQKIIHVDDTVKLSKKGKKLELDEIEGSKMVICRRCNKKFKNMNIASTHFQEIHLATEKFECSLCPCKFKVQRYLNAHMRKKHQLSSGKKKFVSKNEKSQNSM